jgi:uncharacterized protein YyaL (SSP411 family)
MPNALAGETSPYLLQHADNPVDWRPWQPAAFEEARRRDVPVLLSVGYAACHWCHVMAHESFEDQATAAYMNAHFVNVKVDREERPDVDAVYMEATQAMTGHGGWPMTVFLTPDAEPFFCGTYFPPRPRHGMPSFRQLLERVVAAWTGRGEDVRAAGKRIVAQLSARPGPAAGAELTPQLLDAAAASLQSAYDPAHGGFGGAPKFPPPMVLEFLLRQHARSGWPPALAMVEHTAQRMARGGMYDQLGGGFARYSVDAAWVVPHFEKMLYDNALLLRLYAHLWRATGSALAERVVRETAAFLLRDLCTAEGGFASALDADTDGVEGLTYVWTPGQLVDVLGPGDGAWAAEVLAVTPAGTFEHGTSTLQLPADPDDPDRFARVRAALLAARGGRPQPDRDDKVVAAWNGLAIAALADAGALLGEPGWVAAARAAAELLHRLHWVDGRLLRTSRAGVPGRNAGVLDDHGDLADGLLALHQVTGEPRWLAWAGELLELVLRRFPDRAGGFYDTADDAEALVRRPQDPTDNATPSGSSAAAGALLTYAALTGSGEHREAAEAALRLVAPLFGQHARFVGWAAATAEAVLAGPAEVAVVDRPDLERLARLGTAPGAVVVTGGPLADGRPGGAVYVCRGFVCERPATTGEEVRAALQVRVA